MSATLVIRLLGSLDLRLGETSLPALGSARAESLLTYLILNRNAAQPRHHIAFRLWPDSTEAQARTNLRHVLHDLRRALPQADRYLDVGSRTIQWKPVLPVWVDVVAFDAVAARAADVGREPSGSDRSADPIATLREAVGIYRGDLVENCYDEWIADHRDGLRQRYLASLERLAALLGQRGDHRDAIPLTERLLQREPLREDAWRMLMRLHDACGDRAAALRVYQACVETLERELGVPPSTATRELAESFLHADSASGPAAASERVRGRTSAPPLVGRTDEWSRLTTLWRGAADGRPGFLLITGEPGVGKTRLVEELSAWCALRGAITADARSYSAEGSLAYAPVVAWLRTPAVERRLQQLDRGRLSELTRFLPELLSRVPDLPRPQPLPEDGVRHRLFDAAAQALLTLGAPVLLIADDVQWCDHETSRFLHYLLRNAAGTPMLVAATARMEEVERHPHLVDLIAGLRTLGLVTEIELERLTPGATRDLAAALTSRTLGADDADALFRETQGNALFVVEAIRAGWRPGDGTADTLTPRVHAVIASRLGGLSENTREIVGVAAAIGREFTPDMLSQTTDLSADVVARSLDELWRARLVREEASGAYDFSHDRIREVAYLALSPPTRRRLHLRVAQTLKQPGARDPDAVSAQVAAHYDRGGAIEEAVTWYETAAEASQRLFASREAVRLLARALDLVESLPVSPERYARELAVSTSMLTPLASVDGFASRRLRALQDRAVALARLLSVEVPPQVLRSVAITSLSLDDFDAARRYGEQLQGRGRTDADDALLIESEYVLGIAAFWQGDLEAARRHFEAAVSGYRPVRRPAHLLRYWLDPQVVSLSRLGNTYWFLGDADAAVRARDGALALAEEIGHEPSRRTAIVFAAVLALDMADTDRLRIEVAALDTGRPEADTRPTQVSTEVFRAYVRVLDGEVQPGLSTIRSALNAMSDGSHAPGQRAVIARMLIAAEEVAGDPRRRLAAAEQALAMGGAATLWEAEAHRARAESLAALGARTDQVVGALECALAAARRQGAVMLERRTLATLAQLGLRGSASSVPVATG